MGLLTQFTLLLWKNFTLRKRQKVRLVVELLWPLFLFLILVWVRTTSQPFHKGQCHYPNKAMPSAGVLPWLQGMICTMDNPCQSHPTLGETPGQVNNFNNTILAGILIELQTLVKTRPAVAALQSLADDADRLAALSQSDPGTAPAVTLRTILRDDQDFSAHLTDDLSVPAPVVQSLMSAQVTLGPMTGITTPSDLRGVLCEGKGLDRYILFGSRAEKEAFQDVSCSLSPLQLINTQRVLLQNLDGGKLLSEVPSALGRNGTGPPALMVDLARDFLPLFEQAVRLQNSVAFGAARELDFGKDPVGSLGQLICDRDLSGSNNRSASVRSAGLMGITGMAAGNSSDAFCQVLVATMENTPGLRYIWSAFKPLLQGKVLYTPDTPAARRLIKEANATFDALGRLRELVDLWDELGPRVWDFFQDSPRVNALRMLLKNPLFAALVDQRLKGTGWTAELLANFLYNGPPEERPSGMPPYDWRNVYNATTEVLTLLSNFLGCLDLNKFVAVPTEGLLVAKAQELLENHTYWAGIVFENLGPDASEAPPHVKYKIRMDIDEVEGTKKLKDRLWVPGAGDSAFNDLRYMWGGFAYLQDMMDHGIIKAQTSEAPPLGVYAQQMPYPCYVDDGFIQGISGMLPMMLVLAFMYTVCMSIKSLVLEKELRLKEVLRAVGIQNAALWAASFTENLVLLTVPCALISVMVKYGGVLQYSDPSLIFVFLLVFCLTTITQCFLISVFFSKANLAAACGGLIYFALYLPYVLCYAWSDVMGFPAKVAVSVLSCVAFGYGCENFAKYEQQGVGIQWSNMSQSPEGGESYTFTLSIIMMLFDAALYWTLTWYIENVFPGQYGIPKPWYFPFTASYWCGTTPAMDDDPDLLKDAVAQSEYLEKPPPDVKAGVSIRNLVKIYKNGKKLAVDGLSVDFYQNHITSFLGHNGAGKTTTMSILTGLFPPTSGTALISGYDIRTDMDGVRRYLGMCPQHNVLFNELTVEEHVYFYARLKGCSRQQVALEMDQMIADVGLPHKRKELAKNLSGGMQRKLSVAIAFVGGSKIVILDEPTAGVDPYARRGIWELLLKYKQGRTIILSTHHMDEADILGDRIAIISHGKLRCCGSSLFLKKYFGRGYYLTLVRDGAAKMAAQRGGIIQDQAQERRSCSPDEGIGSRSWSPPDPTGLAAVGQLVRRRVPEAVFLESVGQEITFVLPYSGARDGTFAQLFQDLDRAMSDLGLTSYGISDTTLEEIFLKVAEDTGVDASNHEAAELSTRHRRRSSRASERSGTARPERLSGIKGNGEKLSNKVEDLNRKAAVSGKGSRVITGLDLIRRQFLALFIKRFHYARRSRKGLVAQVVLPAVFVCLALIFSLIVPPFSEFPSLELQPWMYDLPQTTFYSNDGADGVDVSRVVDTLVNSPGFGTRCMMGDPIPNFPCSSRGSEWATPPVDPSIADIFLNGNWSMSNPSPSCQCSTPERSLMLPDCPPGAGGLPPPQRTQNTTDTLLDLTGRNVTDFLVKTYKDLGRTRYGGISVGGVNSQVLLTEEEIKAVIGDLRNLLGSFLGNGTDRIFQSAETLLKRMGTRNNVKVWFYNQAWHSVVSFLSVANNAILRGNLSTPEEARRYGISVSNHPLNLTKEQLSNAAMAASSTDVVVSICVIFAMSFIPASFVLFLIQERVSKAKHLQFVSGVNPTVYWLANFTWDMCNYIIPCFIVIVIFLCFQQKAYVSPPNLPALILLLLLYGWSITPLMYPASFVFSVPSTAYVVLTCINLFIGINGSVATFVMELFDDENVAHTNDIVKQVLLIFPHFCLGRGLIDMAKNQAMATLFIGFGEDRFQDPLGWDMVGKNLCAMAIQGAVMFGATILIQYRFFCKPRLVSVAPLPAEDEDVDVARERRRVHEGWAQDDLLRVCDLTKVYPRKSTPAVDRLCVGVPAAECFGLLGINGAGKTTTFKMLTGDIPVSSGEAFLSGYSIRTQMRDVHQNLGYCPQFDAVDELLTGQEHLEFYARLRGVPENEVTMVAEWGIQKLGLVKYANKSAGTYSGGNKRKLSTAMALIGSPPVIFLDEPTTGMDPKARRFLWDCILSIIKEGRSVVLTSHSMEECEALCTRMAIMVNGRFKCLGSIQHLKSRFGDGYTVIVRVGGAPAVLKPVEDFVQEEFPGSVLKEKHHNTLQYQLPYTRGALAHIFSQFQKNQHRLAIEDYSVSETTLDQVFVNFAREQQAEDDSGAYDNPVDTTDELPLRPLQGKEV
ncbi:ATP-binding cassette sub-family A member 1 isoform X3 [Takifugu rubripes]|uniref:ATP-binding cassette sub-family A member 1 isoform X3 n=1 Tax=Takifugu rubripes TaxID=31033 RepID=UPI00114550C9|nr:ATP-binding cassette sub-family A member 1-like isoform X3 [Takifugu rubripes]